MNSRRIIVSLLSGFFLLAGCSPRHMEQSADKEVLEIIADKHMEIELEALDPVITRLDDTTRRETVLLGLKDSLVMAAANNKTYKEQKENVYISVLSLTLQRHQFTNRFGVGGTTGISGNGEESLSARLNLQLVRWLEAGTQITVNIRNDLIRYLAGSRDGNITSIISMNLLQPLLKGAGREIARESLVQSERDSVYAIRNFLRYQKEFSVSATERYMNILLLKNRTDNFYNNYQSLKRTRERIEMLAEAGRMPAIQVDQARQTEYNAQQGWITSVNSYNSAIDNFKIYLGLSPNTPLQLDYDMLDYFITQGLDKEEMDIDYFTKNALTKRLDLITQRDRLQDAQRNVHNTINRLKTELNLTAQFSTTDFDSASYRVGLDFDLPVNKVEERNQFKRALIQLERAERDFENKVHTVTLELSQQYRNFEEAYNRYAIRENSLRLAEQRIQSTDMLLQAGRATTRDILEAEESYLRAQNELSEEMVNYILSYLRFLYSSESLDVDETGVWEGDIYEKVTMQNLPS